MGEHRRIEDPYPLRRLIAYLLAAAVGLALMLGGDPPRRASGAGATTSAADDT